MAVKKFTDEEMMRRVWQLEEIKHLMSLRSYYYMNDMRTEEINEMWVQEPEHARTASFGRNWGYYVGMDAIRNYYVVQHNERRHESLTAMCKTHPELQDTSANLGFGCSQMHPVTTPVVVIADDGKTARGVWYSVIQESEGKPDGSCYAYWSTEVTAADFVLENEKWRIWHLVIASDFICPAGEAFADQPVVLPPENNVIRKEFGTPTIPMLTHDVTFCWEDNYPAFPEPYITYSDKNSYGPKGHPKYKEVY